MSRTLNDPLRLRSPAFVAMFQRYLRRYFARHFNAVRVMANGAPPALDCPTILYANHPSWWDPILLLYVLGRAYPAQRCFGPIDAVALERYAILRRIGMFGIDAESRAGAAEFLRQSRSILRCGDAALCVTAEGTFVDPRVRPVRIKRGIAHLIASGAALQAVPIAIEYAFWLEKKPEALVRIGTAVSAAGEETEAVQARLEAALEHELDQLAEASIARDASAFEVWIDGRDRGVGGVYDGLKRLRAAAKGERFESSHESVTRR